MSELSKCCGAGIIVHEEVVICACCGMDYTEEEVISDSHIALAMATKLLVEKDKEIESLRDKLVALKGDCLCETCVWRCGCIFIDNFNKGFAPTSCKYFDNGGR